MPRLRLVSAILVAALLAACGGPGDRVPDPVTLVATACGTVG